MKKNIAILISSYSHRAMLKQLLENFNNSGIINDLEIVVALDGALDDDAKDISKLSKIYGIKYIEFENNVGKVPNIKRALDFVDSPYVTIFDEDDKPNENFSKAIQTAGDLISFSSGIDSVSFYRRIVENDGGLRAIKELPLPIIGNHYEKIGDSWELHTVFVTDKLRLALKSIRRDGFWPESMFLKEYSKLGGVDLRIPIFIATGTYYNTGLTKNQKYLRSKYRENFRDFYIASIKSKDAIFVKFKRIVQLLRSFK